MISNSCNLGWHYNRNYFTPNNNLDISNSELLKTEATEKIFKSRNKEIIEFKPEQLIDFPNIDNILKIELYTTYPGLLLGAGYEHEISAKGELKLGLFFDHTTGLPIIPGSSIKGVLRSVFPQWNANEEIDEPLKWTKTLFIKSLLINKNIEEVEAFYDSNENEKKALRKEIKDLENIIFEGIRNENDKKAEYKYYSIYDRDIFFDGIIIEKGKDDEIVGIDSITPHIKDGITYERALLKNPTPLPFLKILPNVRFQFNFKLTDNGLDRQSKKTLFRKILTTIGLGAKTNLSYGQLSETKIPNGKSPIVTNTQKTNINDYLFEPGVDTKQLMKKGSIWEGKVIYNKKEKFIIEIDVNGSKVNLKKNVDKIKTNKPVEIGDKVSIIFGDNYNFNNPNFEAVIS